MKWRDGTWVAAALIFVTLPVWGEDQPSRGGEKGASEMRQHMHEGAREMQHMKSSGDPDLDFAMMMRKHHEHGIQMAKDLLANGKDPKTRAMAQRMIGDQQRDLKELDAWIQAHGSAGAAKEPGAPTK